MENLKEIQTRLESLEIRSKGIIKDIVKETETLIDEYMILKNDGLDTSGVVDRVVTILNRDQKYLHNRAYLRTLIINTLKNMRC